MADEPKAADKNLILGITTIGKLLIRNDTASEGEEKGMGEILENLEIPGYQRPYKWTAKNVIRLLDDIEEARRSNKKKYRVGTLILHKLKKKRENKEDEFYDCYDIVDGQQRVITFSLLLKCCIEKLEGKEDLENKVVFLKQKLSDNTDNIRNVPQNYHVLKRRVDLLKNDDCKDLYEYVKGHCELVVIITKDESEAFQFFDSQNARGKKLYPHDLLKAYHLREMNGFRDEEKEEVVKKWEEMNQEKLAALFDKYLYRLKMWIRGDKADELNAKNLDVFKGITSRDNFPCAQYHKSAFAYIDSANKSHIPLVYGTQDPSKFQIDAPVVAGRPFFEYAKHYFELLKDIQDNSKYVGYFINGNPIVETLDKNYKIGAGNEYTRAIFDSAVLLYVDRFCHLIPSKDELDYLDHFVVYAFIWAYSLRLQYGTLQWDWAQNYIMGNQNRINSFNIYKMIVDAATPKDLFGKLSEKLFPLQYTKNDSGKSEVKGVIQLDNDTFGKVQNVKNDEIPDEGYDLIVQWFKHKGYFQIPGKKSS